MCVSTHLSMPLNLFENSTFLVNVFAIKIYMNYTSAKCLVKTLFCNKNVCSSLANTTQHRTLTNMTKKGRIVSQVF